MRVCGTESWVSGTELLGNMTCQPPLAVEAEISPLLRRSQIEVWAAQRVAETGGVHRDPGSPTVLVLSSPASSVSAHPRSGPTKSNVTIGRGGRVLRVDHDRPPSRIAMRPTPVTTAPTVIVVHELDPLDGSGAGAFRNPSVAGDPFSPTIVGSQDLMGMHASTNQPVSGDTN